MADVMADDDTVTEVVEERLERLRLLHALLALVASDAMDGHGFGVALHLEQGAERILEDDLAIDHGDRPDRDDAVRGGVQPRGLGIEHHETHAIEWRVIGPGLLEAGTIAPQECRLGHRLSSQARSAVNSSNRRIDRNPALST